ncbi:MAG: TMEM175 family protein [Thermoplasmatota archaeon]
MDERADVKETARTEGFSDGVFSIAVTLLILDLAVPRIEGISSRGLLVVLKAQIYPLAILTLSFATIFIMWVNHHRVFTRLHHIDNRVMASNGFLLLLVTICPFPTWLVAEYLGKPAANAAAGVYAGYFVLVNIAFNLLIESAARTPHSERHGLDAPVLGRLRRGLRFGFVAYLVATVVAIWSAWASIGICTALWFYWASDFFRAPPNAAPTT